jgi:hypothetical protein
LQVAAPKLVVPWLTFALVLVLELLLLLVEVLDEEHAWVRVMFSPLYDLLFFTVRLVIAPE